MTSVSGSRRLKDLRVQGLQDCLKDMIPLCTGSADLSTTPAAATRGDADGARNGGRLRPQLGPPEIRFILSLQRMSSGTPTLFLISPVGVAVLEHLVVACTLTLCIANFRVIAIRE